MPRALVDVAPQLGVTEPAQTTIGAVATLVALENPKRKGFILQNTGTTVIKITLGDTNPTQSVYLVALRGGAIADDAGGTTYFDNSWVGQVRAISSGAGGTFVFTEFQSGGPDWTASGDLY